MPDLTTSDITSTAGLPLWIILAGLVLGSGTVGAVIVAAMQRPATKGDAVKSTTEAAAEVVDLIRGELERLREEVSALRVSDATLRQQVATLQDSESRLKVSEAALRTEVARLRRRVLDLEAQVTRPPGTLSRREDFL